MFLKGQALVQVPVLVDAGEEGLRLLCTAGPSQLTRTLQHRVRTGNEMDGLWCPGPAAHA